MRAELAAAGIVEAGLRAAYSRCRELNARHGRTYFLATRLLSPPQRPPIHALYAFARWVDDLVDEPPPDSTPQDIAAALTEITSELNTALRQGSSPNPVLNAVIDTTQRFAIPSAHLTAFLRSMRMDVTTTDYPTRAALDAYVYGSAEVIGLQVLPVLGTSANSQEEAAVPAAALGKAFQLTNFLRDVGEDLGRGRVYLPADELAVFGVDRDRLDWCASRGEIDRNVRQALAGQVATTRAVYRRAEPGIAMLHPVSRPCVSTALTLYTRILDRIVSMDYNVFAGRATVGRPQRIAVAGAALARAVWERRRFTAPALPRARF
jgi:phytoene synthase